MPTSITKPQMPDPPNAEVKACEEAVQMALAEVNKYLLVSTYKMDFKRQTKNGVYLKKHAERTPSNRGLFEPLH